MQILYENAGNLGTMNNSLAIENQSIFVPFCFSLVRWQWLEHLPWTTNTSINTITLLIRSCSAVWFRVPTKGHQHATYPNTIFRKKTHTLSEIFIWACFRSNLSARCARSFLNAVKKRGTRIRRVTIRGFAVWILVDGYPNVIEAYACCALATVRSP